MAIDFTVLRTPAGNIVCLKIFKDTSLHHPAFIRVRTLEEYFRYHVTQFGVKIEYWDDDMKLQTSDLRVKMDDLLRDCGEVHEYAQKYFPDYAI